MPKLTIDPQKPPSEGDLPLSDVLKDDDELVVRLVEMSLDMGATDLALQASNLVCNLLDQRQEPIVESLIRRLLGGGGEKRMRAMDLLVQSHENRDVRRAFRDDLSDLVSDPDVGVATSAFFLGSKWRQGDAGIVCDDEGVSSGNHHRCLDRDHS